MQRLVVLAALTTLLLFSAPVAAEGDVVHQARWRTVDFNQRFVEDLTHPEGKTRWELGAVVLTDTWMRTIREAGNGGLTVSDTRRIPSEPISYTAAARDWWLPHLSNGSAGQSLAYLQSVGTDTRTVSVRTKSLGSGWVFLPSGPRQVTLQRSYVKIATDEKSSLTPYRVVYRWVDPRAGTVAEVWGRPGFDGTSIAEFEGAAAIEEVIRGGIGLKIYRTEIEAGNNERLMLGFDRMGTCTIGANACVKNVDCTAGGDDRCTVPISQVVTGAPATMGDVLAQASWDFSPNQLANSRYEIGSTTVAIGPTETCNDTQCGFSTATQMGREDKNFVDPANAFITLSAIEGVDRGTDYTVWLRGGVRHEGVSGGALGESESRFCYVGTDTNGDTRPEVPLWRFPNNDGEWYMQLGDSWGNTPVFACEQSVFNHVCPSSCGLFCNLWISGCSGLPGEGQQSSVIIDEGPVTLPSGHTFDALLSRQVVDFCTYLFNACDGSGVAQVHQVLYLWVVPNLGTVARMMSEQEETSDTTFTDLQEIDVKYGVFPPVSITLTGQTDNTISISWDPGSVTHHIDGYKVYWDTDSGNASPYAFNSVDNAGQVSIVGTTATISGLNPGVDHYITVTTLSDYANPSAGVTHTFESLVYPKTTGGTAPLPPELVGTTTGGLCTPTTEVSPCQPQGAPCVTADKAGTNVEFCWVASGDACEAGYGILGAGTPDAAVNFSTVVGDTGAVSCHTFDPTETYFIIVGKGSGGTGPWGHYGM